MTMLGSVTVTDGGDNVIATGNGFHEYDPTVQMYDVQDNGLQQGAHYTLVDEDGAGWQGITFVGYDGQYANFDNSVATQLPRH